MHFRVKNISKSNWYYTPKQPPKEETDNYPSTGLLIVGSRLDVYEVDNIKIHYM
jgi:hypothetical protein